MSHRDRWMTLGLVWVLALAAGSRAAAQTSTLSVTGGTTRTIPQPGATQYDVGATGATPSLSWSATCNPGSASTKCLIQIVSACGGACTFGPSNRPLSDLQFSVNGGSIWTPMSATGAPVQIDQINGNNKSSSGTLLFRIAESPALYANFPAGTYTPPQVQLRMVVQ